MSLKKIYLKFKFQYNDLQGVNLVLLILTFLEDFKLLSPTQFGYCKKRNTELTVTLLFDEIRRNTDIGNVTGAIFIDLSQAFDTLSHAQIIESLTSYGVTGTENELFINYLFGRKQAVCYDKEISKAEFVTCGVTQGSILGPLLFLITFNDIHSVLSHSNIITYADDTVIYVSRKNKDEAQSKLQADFQAVFEWFQSADLITNMKKGKTECMLFGTVQKVKNKSLIIENNSKVVSNTVNTIIPVKNQTNCYPFVNRSTLHIKKLQGGCTY